MRVAASHQGSPKENLYFEEYAQPKHIALLAVHVKLVVIATPMVLGTIPLVRLARQDEMTWNR
jgi:hypothetical protein